ncbi:hypothetical protein OOK31_13705 [Streptomyces sp. NBC_00249]|uniref:hypothetical protein n=1 Tax=Streptomyces sp. NBC_00249 TaxID=2975690 RepID=UPI0022520C0B|nr:hypothetical protein [Streptomyces sp. NBC_00249]MCX5194945.1 hypothetical protein [Streptomyces sp. NBC_00249]
MPSRELPPPPPPAHLRQWMDETVVRADRARFLEDLSRRSLGLGRLLLLWTVAAVFAFGWTFLGMAVMSFEEGDLISAFFGIVYAVIGAGVLVPAGFWFASGARQERRVRHLLCAWVEAGRDPAADARLRAPARSLVWLLASLALGAVGLWVAFGAAAGATPGEDTYGEVAYIMGFGMILWITALLGLAKAGAHYRWAVRAFRPPAGQDRPGRILSDAA